MTKSAIFTKAHAIAQYKDEAKEGNNIFRMLSSRCYAAKFKAALKFVYKQIKKTVVATTKVLNPASFKQWEYLNKLRVTFPKAIKNFNDFQSLISINKASQMIGDALNGFKNFSA